MGITYLTPATDHFPEKPPPISPVVAAIVALTAGMGLPEVFGPKSPPKPARKCLMPGCENLTQHNGGYCSATHCREHREMKARTP